MIGPATEFVTGRGPLLTEDGQVLAVQVHVAKGFWGRWRGLMGRRTFPTDAVLIFPRTGSIHTFFMRFAIDVVFLDRSGRVLRVVRSAMPWRIGPAVKGAYWTLEFVAGAVPKEIGSRLYQKRVASDGP